MTAALVVASTGYGLVLRCSECGDVTEYASADGDPKHPAPVDEIAEDALLHAQEHAA